MNRGQATGRASERVRSALRELRNSLVCGLDDCRRDRVLSQHLSRIRWDAVLGGPWLLALLLLSSCSPSERGFFDFSREPDGELVQIASLWKYEALLLEGTVKSEVPARLRFGDTCDGYVSEAPDYILRLTSPQSLRFQVSSPTNADLVMVLTGRSGLRCNDDFVGLMPGMQTRLGAGDYSVFVGTLTPTLEAIPYVLDIRPAVATAPFQGLSSVELEEELERLDQWPSAVSAAAIASLEERVVAQRVAFGQVVPVLEPDLQVLPRVGSFRVERDSTGEIFHSDIQSTSGAALWQVAKRCGGFVPRRGADAVLRVSAAFGGRIQCTVVSQDEVELAIRGPEGHWLCGGRQTRGLAVQSFEPWGSGEYAVTVASVEGLAQYRGALSCDVVVP